MSVLAYYIICDSPSEIGLEEFTQTTTMKSSRTENKTVENRKEYTIALLKSPFLWVLSTGYLMTLFVKTGVGEWTQLFLIQTVGKTQYHSEYMYETRETACVWVKISVLHCCQSCRGPLSKKNGIFWRV